VGAELVWLIAPGAAGTAALGAIALRERASHRAMRASTETFSLVFPAGASETAATSALLALSGLNQRQEVAFEVVATAGEIGHRFYVPKASGDLARGQLSAALPGLRITSASRDDSPARLRLALRVPGGTALRQGDAEASGRALLASLLPLRRGEMVRLVWTLQTGRPRLSADPASISAGERTRLASPGFRVAGRILVRAQSPERATALAARVLAVLRSRRTPGPQLTSRQVRNASDLAPIRSRDGWLPASEILSLLAWPLGPEISEAVTLATSRRLAPKANVATSGRLLFVTHEPERPIRLSQTAATHHAALLGPTGSGKSAILVRGILDEIEAGRGGALLDPKGDTVTEVLDRLPEEAAGRVVVIDASDPGAIPGVRLLGTGDPNLAADLLVGIFGALFAGSWGVRSEHYVRLAARTLAEGPDPSLLDLPRILTDSAFRRQAVGRVRDPLLAGAWATFEALSEAERAAHLSAPLSRLLALLGRPSVRAILAQPDPKLDVTRLLGEGKWLLVSTARGVLGKPASRLVGAVLAYVIWQAVEARAQLPQSARRPVMLFFDEVQALADLPFGLEQLFEQSRGLGVGVTVATQALRSLPGSLDQSLLANVATLVTFRAGHDEASRVARELPGLSGADVQGLGPFEVAARIGVGAGAASAVVTGHTLPLPEPFGHAAAIRAASSQKYGRSREEIEKALRERYAETGDLDASLAAELGRTGRQP